MAVKTVLKKLINQYGPKSLEMQTAIESDQSVVNNYEKNEFEYPDNGKPSVADEINEQFSTAEVVEPIPEDDEEIM